MLPFAPVTVCTLCYCKTFAEKLFQKRKKNWIKLGQKWLCNAILHVDMQMVRKKHSFSIVKDSKWGKKNKMLLNLYTSLLDFFGVLMKFDRKLSRQAEIQLADSQNSDGHFPVCQHSSLWADKAKKKKKSGTASTRHHFILSTGKHLLTVAHQYSRASVG